MRTNAAITHTRRRSPRPHLLHLALMAGLALPGAAWAQSACQLDQSGTTTTGGAQAGTGNNQACGPNSLSGTGGNGGRWHRYFSCF